MTTNDANPTTQRTAAPRRARRCTRAAILVGIFIAVLLVPGLYQVIYGWGRADVARWRDVAREQPLADVPRTIEADVNARFLAGQAARTLMLGVPVKAMRPMSPEVFKGWSGYLYNDVDVQVCRSAGFLHRSFTRPRRAADTFAELSRRLQQRGIHLLVVPVPAKASIYPELIDRNYDVSRGPNLNVHHTEYMQYLRDGGVDVLDLTNVLWTAKAEGPVFYPIDTHWSQRAMGVAAGEIAARLRERVPGLPDARSIGTRWIDHVRYGDLSGLSRSAGQQFDDSERANHEVHEKHLVVIDAGGQPLRPGGAAPIAVIGDSFAAQFVDEGASVSNLLMQRLGGVPVQSLAVYGGKGPAIVGMLNDRSAELGHKRAVVLIFTIRLLLCCDWDRAVLPNPSGVPTAPVGQ